MSPTTISTTSIEDLPPEMISELFKNLPPKDLVACSMVNKGWHSIYANFKLHSLVAKDYESDPEFENFFFRWYDSNQTVEEKCFCYPAMFCDLVEKPLLSNLKHLALNIYRFKFDLNKLNRFRHLVHLEIENYLAGKVHLNLPRLRVLAFHHFNYAGVLSIDCPLINTLVYHGEDEDANLLEVKHPETIRKLETNMFGAKLTPFKDVECLVTGEYRTISKATLLSLPRLREFHYNTNIYWVFIVSPRGAGTVDRIKRTLNEFLGEAKELRGSDFRFRFAGLQLTNRKEINKIDFDVKVDERSGRERVSNEYVYMKNYHLIEPGALHFIDRVDYSLLLDHVTGEFPRCFSQKFTNIRWVYATNEVQDPDHFLWSLKSQKSLRGLILGKTKFSQEFYDQLPASAPLLTALELREGHCEDGLQVNFIGRLSHLTELKIEPAISLESLPLLVRSLGRLDEGRFHVRPREELFRIEKERFLTEWKVEKAGRLLFKTEDFEEIVHFFQGL